MTDKELYKDTFSRLQASGETLTEVMKMTENHNCMKHWRKKQYTAALVTVILMLALTTTALAVAYHADISAWFNGLSTSLYGKELDDKYNELLGELAVDVGQSAECNGTTVTAEALVGDEYSIMLMLRVKVPEGTVLDGAQYDFADTDITINCEPYGGGYECSSVDITYNECLLILTFTAMPEDGSAINNAGYTLNIKLGNFSEFVDGVGDVTEAEGSWEFEIPLAYELTEGVELLNESFSFYGLGMITNESITENEPVEQTIKSFEFTPMGYKMTYDPYTPGVFTVFNVVLKDGTEVKRSSSSNYVPDSRENAIEVGTWTIPIDINDVAYIKFGNGITVPVVQLPVTETVN